MDRFPLPQPVAELLENTWVGYEQGEETCLCLLLPPLSQAVWFPAQPEQSREPDLICSPNGTGQKWLFGSSTPRSAGDSSSSGKGKGKWEGNGHGGEIERLLN